MSHITIEAQAEDGSVIDVLVDRDYPPKLGEYFEHEGQLLLRTVTAPSIAVRRGFYAHTSTQLPRRKHAAKHGRTLAPDYDSKGRPLFKSRSELERYVGEHNDNPRNGTKISYDPDGNE